MKLGDINAGNRAIDITNRRFGRLTAIKPLNKRKGRRVLWECICDCGNKHEIASSKLTDGHVKSCGCLRKEPRRILPETVAAFNMVINSYKQRCKKKNINWGLSDREAKYLFISGCYYCSSGPKNIQKGIVGDFVYNGIDRINSSKGYEIDNVVPCCKRCNVAKSDMSVNEFLLHNLKIYRHRLKTLNAKEVYAIKEVFCDEAAHLNGCDTWISWDDTASEGRNLT